MGRPTAPTVLVTGIVTTLPPRSPADLATWLATSPPADVAIGLLLLVAAVVVASLSAQGVRSALALLLRAPRAVRVLARGTPAGLRAAVQRAVVVSLLTATCAAPTATAASSGGAVPPGLRVPSSTAVAPAPRTDAVTVTVAPGDHLWAISARAVAAVRGVDVGIVPVTDVARHWVSLVRHNRAHLRSGDPDLIHPGEEIRLPPVDGTGDAPGR